MSRKRPSIAARSPTVMRYSGLTAQRPSSSGKAAPSSARTNAAATSGQAKPLEQQLKELDTLTRWPTHRIRSFLVTQSRSVR